MSWLATVSAAFLLLQLQLGAQAAEEIDLTNTTIYSFGGDFAASAFQKLIFEYGLTFINNAKVVYTAIPPEGVQCGYEGNTNDECASMFHLFNEKGLQLDFDGYEHQQQLDGRHLQDSAGTTLEIDFAISPDPVVIPSLPDVQNYPAFVYGVAPAFNIPGVTKLVLTREALARIFRGCEYVEPSAGPTSSPSLLTASPTASPTLSTSSPSLAPSTAPSSNPTSSASTFAPSDAPTAAPVITLAPTLKPTTLAPTTTPSSYCLPGSITRWDDEAILATNPPSIHHLLTSAGKIKVFVDANAGPNTHTFKHALSRFEPLGFGEQVGNANDATWGGTNFERVRGSYGALRKVYKTPGSITFDNVHHIAQQAGVYAIHLQVDEGKIIYPSTVSLFSSFFEVGLDFGNDGNSKDMLTIDLTVANGIQSWPISQVAYVSTRTQHTPRNCIARKQAMLSFFEFVYTKVISSGRSIFDEGLAPLPQEAGVLLLDIMRSQLRCDGELVHQVPPSPPRINIMAEDTLHSLLGTFLQDSKSGEYMVQIRPPQTHSGVRDAWICMSNITSCPYRSDLVIFADEKLIDLMIADARMVKKYNIFTMPYLAVATGFIYNFCLSSSAECDYRYTSPLVLDVTIAANILDGNIVWWNDTAIAALNPTHNLPKERIIVFAGPKYSSYHLDFVQKVRNTYMPSFGYRLGDDDKRDTFYEAWMDVSLTPYSFSFVVFNGTVVEGVEKVALRNDQGVDVAATPESIEACAMDTYDPENRLFRLSNSIEPDCYPLTTAFTIITMNPLAFIAPAKLIDIVYKQSLRAGKGSTALSTSGFGTLTDLKMDGYDFEKMNLENLESIRSSLTGASVLRVPHELSLIPQEVIHAMYAVMGIELAIFLLLAIWTLYNRNRKLIRNSSPLFMMQVLLGAAIMAATVIPLSFQDDYLIPRAMTLEELTISDPVLDLACVINPILFSMGFFITFSAIFLKTWRLIRIFNNVKLKNLFLRDRQLLIYQTIVVNVIIILNAAWAGADPMVWQRRSRYMNDAGQVVGSMGVCYSRGGIGPAMPLIIGIVLLLVVGNYLAYLGRRIPTEFNESKWTAMSMMVILEAFVIAVPVLVLSNDEPVPGFIVKSLVILLVAGATVGLIFVPKIMLAYGWGEDKDTSNPWRFVRASDSSNNTKNSKKVAQQQDAMISQIVGPTFSNNNLGSSQMVRNADSSAGAGVSNNRISTLIPASHKFPSPSASTSEALARILQDDPSRRKFRRFLKTLKMEENVRFWDATMITKAEQNENKRYAGTRAVVQSFVSDNSPFQVNLSSATKQAIMSAYDADDKQKLKDPKFFDKAMAEMFDDLRQSDAFRAFMENDTFSTQYLA